MPRLEAVNWSFAFNRTNMWSFDIKQLSNILHTAAQKHTRFASISEKTFERDASCLIRMYVEETSEKESEIDCPFTELGLMRRAEEKNEVSFNNTEKTTLPPLILQPHLFLICVHMFRQDRELSLFPFNKSQSGLPTIGVNQ